MKLGFVAYKNMISKPLNMVLSLLLLVLSISLVTFVFQLSKQLNGQMDKNINPVDMVVGAKGSPLQLVLSSVLHIDAPTGNIKFNDAKKLMKHPFVGSAIPVSYGDNYKGYRILGTKPVYLERYGATLHEGRLYTAPFEIVAGSSVVKKLGLKLGDTITSSHGLAAGGEEHGNHPFTIVGILKPSGTVVDQLLVSNLKSIWQAHDHGGHDNQDESNGEDHHDKLHESHANGTHGNDEYTNGQEHDSEKEITSLLVKFKSPLGLVQLPRFINENTNMQAALPGFEIQRLTKLLGSGAKTLNGIALAILLVSGFSIFISLLKTIRERRQELALLRTYGLGTLKLLFLVLYEGLLLAFIGFLSGWLLGRLGLILTSSYMEASYGYVLAINGPDFMEWSLLGITLLIAIIAVILASTSIFKMNISKTLSDV